MSFADKTQCLKCGHDINNHKISIFGNYEFEEISCQAQGNDYDEQCGCDAGFRKVIIKKEFTSTS